MAEPLLEMCYEIFFKYEKITLPLLPEILALHQVGWASLSGPLGRSWCEGRGWDGMGRERMGRLVVCLFTVSTLDVHGLSRGSSLCVLCCVGLIMAATSVDV